MTLTKIPPEEWGSCAVGEQYLLHLPGYTSETGLVIHPSWEVATYQCMANSEHEEEGHWSSGEETWFDYQIDAIFELP